MPYTHSKALQNLYLLILLFYYYNKTPKRNTNNYFSRMIISLTDASSKSTFEKKKMKNTKELNRKEVRKRRGKNLDDAHILVEGKGENINHVQGHRRRGEEEEEPQQIPRRFTIYDLQFKSVREPSHLETNEPNTISYIVLSHTEMHSPFFETPAVSNNLIEHMIQSFTRRE